VRMLAWGRRVNHALLLELLERHRCNPTGLTS
jgi:hypothetical protein